jgi:peptidoglycan biosynthesis protein MviN/MurJ (putative lipid II flippase)
VTAPGDAVAPKAIIRAILTVGLFAVAGRLVGAAKEIAVAWRFGISAEVDAYLFIFNLVNLPISIWLSVLSVVLVPMAARLASQSPADVRRFRAEMLGVTLVAGLLLSVLAWLLLPGLVASSRLGLPAHTAELAAQMVPALAWLIVIGFLAGTYAVWVMSAGRHINTLLEGMPALAILVGVLITGGIAPLVWGTLIGMGVQAVILVILSRLPGAMDRPAFSLRSPEWKIFWQGFGLVLLGQVVLSVATLVDQFFAAGQGTGAISSIGYANRILLLLLSVGGIALTRAMLPVFSQAQLEPGRVRGLALRWSGYMWLLGAVAAGIGWVLAPWGVRLLFERGTFLPSDTEVVAHLLRHGLPQLPFYLMSLVLVSLHSSTGRYGVILASGILGLAVKIIASTFLLSRMGIAGLMLSQTFVYAANAALLARVAPE